MAKAVTGKKATRAQMTVRVNDVFTKLLDAWSRKDIVQYAAKTWKISARQADVLIRKATEAILAKGNIHRQFQLGKAMARLERWLKEVMASPPSYFGNTFMAAKTTAIRGVIRDMNELSGLLKMPDEGGSLDMAELARTLNEDASAYPETETKEGKEDE